MPTLLTTMACVVSDTGCLRPTYADILYTLQQRFKGIYGSDSYIDPDSQDGQLLAVFAKAIDDCNAATQASYFSYSPATAQGAALSIGVKINGIKRASATKSTANLTVGGTVGTTITNGAAQDTLGNLWDLPASVVIPPGATIVVTATARQAGSIGAQPGTITKIATPILGWQTVTNVSAASIGAPVEVDATLRQRQAASVAQPSRTVLAGIYGAVAALAGVTQVRVYENDTNAADANGIPAKSIAVVVLGGIASAIASAIGNKKTPGCFTYGTTAQNVVDSVTGLTSIIRFFVPTQRTVKVTVTGTVKAGYTAAIGAQIQAAIAAYINSLGIGSRVDISRLFLPAQLYGGIGWQTYEITSIQISWDPAAVGSADLVPAFNELPVGDTTKITVNIT